MLNIWKAIYSKIEKRFTLLKMAKKKLDPRVVPMKDPVVKVLYYNHPIHGDTTAMIRKSKIKYGGY